MLLNSRIIYCWIVCMFMVKTTFTQIDTGFIRHLSENQLKNEHWTYLNEVKIRQDSLEYFKAKFHLQYENDSLFLHSFDKSFDLFYKDTSALYLACLHFLKTNSKDREKWFGRILDDMTVNQYELHPIVHMYYYSLHPVDVDISQIPEQLQKDMNSYKKADKKKPILASTLSAIIPGLGELYIGNKKVFGTRLIALGLMAFQTVESLLTLGFKHPLTIIDGGFFSAFYVTNIVGVYYDTKAKKTETKNQFLINASNYFSAVYQYQLY